MSKSVSLCLLVCAIKSTLVQKCLSRFGFKMPSSKERKRAATLVHINRGQTKEE